MTQPRELFDLEEMLSPPGLALLSVMTALAMAVDRTLDMPTRTALADAFEEEAEKQIRDHEPAAQGVVRQALESMRSRLLFADDQTGGLH